MFSDFEKSSCQLSKSLVNSLLLESAPLQNWRERQPGVVRPWKEKRRTI